MFNKKPDAPAKANPTKWHDEFLADLATIYPEIVGKGGDATENWWPLSVRFRVQDVRDAADGIRRERGAKRAAELIKEFRGK